MNTIAMRVLSEEINALYLLKTQFPENFDDVLNIILLCSGKVITSGMGKSGYIARKIAASFSSTGTPSYYIHPAEANHGDLGSISHNDILLIFSNSGETTELFNIMEYCRIRNIITILITSKQHSTLASKAGCVLLIPSVQEASRIDAPTSSCIMMLALGDALMIAAQETKNFTQKDFKLVHPSGSIGEKLSRL